MDRPVELRYGINPEQCASAESLISGRWPLRLVAGQPSYINLLDALNSWQLVKEAAMLLGRPVAASFKHVSPAGVALAGQLDAVMEATWETADCAVSSVAGAYLRARDSDPKSSFGDFVAVSDPVDTSLAHVLSRVVADGIIAPGFEPGTIGVLAAKKHGSFLILESDPSFEGSGTETRELYGLRLEHQTATTAITRAAVAAGASNPLPPTAVDDLVLAMVTARYTQSNSVVFTRDGMVLGVGAGQQSRVDCTRLAGAKVDTWWMRRHRAVRDLEFHPNVKRQDRINWQIRFAEGDLSQTEAGRLAQVLATVPDPLTADQRHEWLGLLDRVALASDGYIPFRDNIDQAARHGVRFIADPGGSTKSNEVAQACAEHGITLSTTGIRLFHH